MTTNLHCVFLPVFALGLLLLLLMSLLQLVSRSRFLFACRTIYCKLFCFNYYTFQLFHTRTTINSGFVSFRFFFALCLGVTHTKRIEIRCGLQKLVGLLWFFFSRSPTNPSSTSDTVHSNVNNLQPAQLFNAST